MARRASAIGQLARFGPPALLALLAIGVALRIAIWFAYEPTPLFFNDTLAFVGMAHGQLFFDPTHSVGYPLLLDALHALSPTIAFAVVVQHLLGIATALLVFATFHRLAVPTWVAVVAAGGVLLSLDQVLLEHSLLAEAGFTFAVALSLYLAVRALEEPRKLRGPLTTRAAWICAAGAAIGLAAWLRPVALPLAPLFVIWCACAFGGAWRARLGHATAAALGSGVVLLGYAVLQSAETGSFGLSRASGWAFYSRVAPFADCDRFDPPAGTEELCETVPPEDRNGPDFYGHDARSPAKVLYGGPPTGNAELSAFARAALVAQPLDYLGAVATDSLRYFVPSLGERPYGGGGYEVIDIDRGAPRELVVQLEAGLGRHYSDADVEAGGLVDELASLQDVLRLQPWALAVAIVLGAAGIVLAPGRLRIGLVLLFGTSVALMLIPPATAIWGARYAVPVTGQLVGCAAAGAWLLSTRRSRGGAPGSSAP